MLLDLREVEQILKAPLHVGASRACLHDVLIGIEGGQDGCCYIGGILDYFCNERSASVAVEDLPVHTHPCPTRFAHIAKNHPPEDLAQLLVWDRAESAELAQLT